MGWERVWVAAVWVVLCTLSRPNCVEGSETYKSDDLDSFIHDYSFKNTPKPRTGTWYNVSLPANYSGMEIAFARFRTGRLWKNGVNFSSFEFPPRILPRPFVKRVDLAYQNLGNWSSFYYNVPNHTLIAPVIGLLPYDSNKSSASDAPVELGIMGKHPIIVKFPNVVPQESKVPVKCVRFSSNGAMEFSNVTDVNSCVSRKQGHFSIVVPFQTSDRKGEWRGLKWREVGLIGGVVGLVLLVFVGVVACKCYKDRRMRRLERQSERGEVLDTIWIGRSRMPSASSIRTQPILENSYIP